LRCLEETSLFEIASENRWLDGLLSQDPSKVRDAAFEIISSRDIERLAGLASYVPQLKEHASTVELGGALISNKDHLLFAIRKIEFAANDQDCLCQLYPEYTLFNPHTESSKQNIIIHRSEVKKELYEEHFDVSCFECGQTYFVREVHGYHYPWYEWKRTNHTRKNKAHG
jgi:hypothetical protein